MGCEIIELGVVGDVVLRRIAMRPGRPFAVGRIGNTALFGLPGVPNTSAASSALHHSQGNVAVGDLVDVMMFHGVV